MHALPHTYTTSAAATADSNVSLSATGLDTITSAAPAEFGGPGDLWSPETLLVAAVADCFILSFRAIARASGFDWLNLECDVEGILDRADGGAKFTRFSVRAKLSVESDDKRVMGERLLHKAEQSCLITNSLSADSHLEVVIDVID